MDLYDRNVFTKVINKYQHLNDPCAGLWVAAVNDHPNLCHFYIDRGAHNICACLRKSCELKSPNVAKELLHELFHNEKVQINYSKHMVKDCMSQCFVTACENNNFELIQVLLDYKTGINVNQALIKVSKTGNLNIVKLLCNNGATSFDEACFEAAKNGHLQVVKYVLAQSHQKKVVGQYLYFMIGKAMCVALDKEYMEIVEILRDEMQRRCKGTYCRQYVCCYKHKFSKFIQFVKK